MNRKPLTGWAGFLDALAGAAILAAFIGGMLAIWMFKAAGL